MTRGRFDRLLAAAILLLAGSAALVLAPPTEAEAGKPEPSAICLRQDDCEKSEICQKPTGGCGANVRGNCRPHPEACPSLYQPVCGCDGETYSNACEAARARTSVAHQGACVQTCKGDRGCEQAEYCAKPEGACAAEGVCAEVPGGVCTQLYQPVCGCDRKTYSNPCQARLAGVNVASQGECPRPCRADRDCADGSLCLKPDGQCSSAGLCRSRPQVCPQLYDPVCGCDHKTYSNPCQAHRAGANVASEGECPSLGLQR